MSASFKDHFSEGSDQYSKYRPKYPSALFEYIVEVAPRRELAWDCATGSGQSAVALARHFSRVIATDASSEQIAAAEQAAGVEYRVAPAEASGLKSGCVDVVTVAQALHWFDVPAFFAEVERTLRSGGILAVWSYGLASIRAEVDAIVHELYETTLGAYWPPERRLVESGYAEIAFPFDRVDAPPFAMTAEWTLRDLRGYLQTWSATKRFVKHRGFDPVAKVEEALAGVWPEAGGAPLTVTWPLSLKASRKA